MNINIDGITRPMTAEEVAEFERTAAEIAEAQAQAEAGAAEADYLAALERFGVR